MSHVAIQPKYGESEMWALNINKKHKPLNINFNASKEQGLNSDTEEKSSVLWLPPWPCWLTMRECETDLGVMITSKLKWKTQVLKVSAEVNKTLGLLHHTCPMLIDVKVKRSLYLAPVKCHMSYATEVWSPSHSMLKLKGFREELHIGFYKSSKVNCPTKKDWFIWICCCLIMTARSRI